MKILIVEDEKTLSQVMKEKFEAEKFTVKVADDGGMAMDEVRGMQPDLVLLDLMLPGKPGLDVLKEMKEDQTLKNIPVIIMSNLDGDEEIKTAMRLGAVDYFVKVQHPIKEVVEKVSEFLLKAG